ncbi:MAG TPA: DinB family protein [Actinomycetota bacterium]
MPQVDEHGRPEPPLTGDEAETLLGFLDYQRATLEWKCRGLDATGLNTTTAASTVTLGGLLKHIAFVEESWFCEWLRGRDRQPPWDGIDWDADPDWDWRSAADDSPEALRAIWADAVAESRAAVKEALAEGGLDQMARRTWPSGDAPSMRWILTHMIEEYARHNGHADFIRESIDGETGE